MTPAYIGFASTFWAGLALSLSLIAAIGPQNAHLMRLGLNRQYVWTTVITSIIADALLIALGVIGLSKLGGLSIHVHQFMLLGGAAFLIYYGAQAALRCAADKRSIDLEHNTKPVLIKSRSHAIVMALVFSWLNPHAWIDTAVLIGAASLAYSAPGHAIFGAGAMMGSLVWFVLFGGTLCWLGARINQFNPWRAIDGLVAVMMLATSAYLLHSSWLLF